MCQRSRASVLIAASLAAVVVSRYVGPALCTMWDGQPVETEHCDEPSSHGSGAPGVPQWTVPDHSAGCPDAALCTVWCAGAVIRRPVLLAGDWAPDEASAAPAARIGVGFTGPPTPPPKV
jgi:hypothetical protein